MINNFKKEIEEIIKKKFYFFEKKINSINTNKVSITFFENLLITYFKQKILLKYISNIVFINNYSIKIEIYDNKYKKSIIKSISNYNLGYQIISINKNSLKIILPPITEEQRNLFIKLLEEEKENKKISIRNIRQNGKKKIKLFLTNKNISKDDYINLDKFLQKITEEYLQKIIILINNKIQNININK